MKYLIPLFRFVCKLVIGSFFLAFVGLGMIAIGMGRFFASCCVLKDPEAIRKEKLYRRAEENDRDV